MKFFTFSQDHNKNDDLREDDKVEDKPKPKIDVLAELPALNLSESDSSDSENETDTQPSTFNAVDNTLENSQKENTQDSKLDQYSELEQVIKLDADTLLPITSHVDTLPADTSHADTLLADTSNVETSHAETSHAETSHSLNLLTEDYEKDLNPVVDDLDSSNSVIQNIWDNFKNYQASKEKLDNFLLEPEKFSEKMEDIEPEVSEQIKIEEAAAAVVLMDHDYCIDVEKKPDTSIIEVRL